MTIPVETPTVTYLGNGSTTAFNFDFVIPDTSEIVLTITDSSGNQTTPDPSTYSIIPNDPAPGSLWSDGGVVNYPLSGSPLATGNTFTITRDVPYDQDVTISNQGVFYPQAVEQGLDLLAMQTQQTQNTQKYAIQTPVTDVNPPNVLPPASIRAGGTLGFDGDGQPIIVGGGSTIGTVTSVGLTLPAFITVTGTPVTTTGVIAGTLATQTANTHFAGPITGSAAAPTFRALVPADLPVATTGALGAVKPDGTTITISGGTISASGSGLGTVTSVGLALPTFITVSGSPVTGSGTLTGTLATQLTNTFFAGPNGSTGTPTFRTIAAGDLPLATTGAFGAVKPDGTTVTISAGVISAVTSVSGANPSATAGPTAVNGSATTYMRSDGAPAIQLATASVKGLVQVDGTTITATAGVITAIGGVSGANPTASAGPTAINGSATTYLRSDGAPAIQQGSALQKGILQVDGTTILASSGIISAVNSGGSTGLLSNAWHPLYCFTASPTVSVTLPINGGAVLTQILVSAPMSLQGLTIHSTDTTLLRTAEWRLYQDAGSATANQIVNANGTFSFTAASASNQESDAQSPPVTLSPGLYWLVVRNTSASNTFSVGSAAASSTLGNHYSATQTLASGLGSTLNLITSWTQSTTAIMGVFLGGRVLGQTAGGY